MKQKKMFFAAAILAASLISTTNAKAGSVAEGAYAGAFMGMGMGILQAKVTEKFHNPFQVPPLATAERKGRDLYFNLRVQSGKSAILPNVLTPTLGINLPFLGETIRANRGDRVHIKVKNSLNETTTLHWHGMKLPAKMDGGPHQPILPDAEICKKKKKN